SVHPHSSAVRFSGTSVKIAAAQKEVTVRALEFATRFEHLCAAIGAHPGHIGRRRCSLWRGGGGGGVGAFVPWGVVEVRPTGGANAWAKPARQHRVLSNHQIRQRPLSTGLS